MVAWKQYLKSFASFFELSLAPNSPFNLYGMTQAIRVKIVSIVLNNSGKNEGRDASATVRFQRFILNKANGISRYVDSNIATLTYKYNNNLKGVLTLSYL